MKGHVVIPKKSLQQKKKKSDPQVRLQDLDRLHRELEAKIMMTDDEEELLLMGSLFLTIARNIFVAIHSPKKAKLIINKFSDNIKEEDE